MPAIALGPPVSSVTRTPRRITSRGCSCAAAAIADSVTGRRPVTKRSASTLGRGARSEIPGGKDSSGSTHAHPAASSRSVSAGSSSSQTRRNRANRLWGWRNGPTPFRRHDAQAAPGVTGTLSESVSSAVTWCPSLPASSQPTTRSCRRRRRRSSPSLPPLRSTGLSGTPYVDDVHRLPLGLGRQVVAENLGEQGVDDRVQPLIGEPVAVLLGLPDVEVPQTALGLLGGDVDDEAFWRDVTEAVGDPLVESGIDGDVLRERVSHGYLADIDPN